MLIINHGYCAGRRPHVTGKLRVEMCVLNYVDVLIDRDRRSHVDFECIVYLHSSLNVIITITYSSVRIHIYYVTWYVVLTSGSEP